MDNIYNTFNNLIKFNRMITTNIFFLATLLSYQTLELLIIDAINKSDDNNNTRFFAKIIAIILWTIFYHLT